MPEFSIYQIDAFTDHLFGGNPAAVCPLQEWLPDDVLQNLAMENNLSETAFFVPKDNDYELRWFVPMREIDLCGHATLASAHVLFNHLGYVGNKITFHSRKAGALHVTRDGKLLTLDFPARPPEACPLPAGTVEALGGPTPIYSGAGLRDYLFVYEDEDIVRNMQPDFRKQSALGRYVIVSAPGKKPGGPDFVSRFFCGGDGIDEDPVTGSAHCTLVPYWAEKLGKTKLLAHQVSARGGVLHCELRDNRVFMGGQAVTYMQGTYFIP